MAGPPIDILTPPLSDDTAERQYRRRAWIFAAGLLLIVLLAQVAGRVTLPEPELGENRVLADWPARPATLAEAQTWPAQLDAWLNDHGPARVPLIAGLNWLRWRLGYSTVPRVVLGRDGWLFYNDGPQLRIFTGRQQLDEPKCAAWATDLKRYEAAAAANGASFTVLIAPQKPTIYPEHMPAWTVPTATTEVDRLVASAAGDPALIYPKVALLGAKANGSALYTPNDVHWTGDGAYIAYRALMMRVAALHPDDQTLTPLEIGAFTRIEPLPRAATPRDLALMIGIASFVPQPWVRYAPLDADTKDATWLTDNHDWTGPHVIETSAENNRTLLLLRDSFSTALLPFLRPHFRHIVLAHVQDGFWRADLIARFHPDTIMLEVIESGARYAMDAPTTLP